ncbi:MAG TPA: maleylpyruvate isomerase family mycothiol-dependent enzyme [Actinomycetes bacterium]|nr:maleylpyruvate isomerase family mycothiol-dependent enzyme [Actinomycetes bacterium]
MESDVVVVTQLLQSERASLLELLSSLGADQWQASTVCPGWSVKDVALHLLGDDIGLLSRRRDGAAPADASREPGGFQELVALDRLNQTWVEAARRISPRLLCELLAFTGEATWRYLASLDPLAVEARVSWVRPDPVPNWLDVAREYTERWTHQQQIRDAVGVPGLKQAEFMAPVLATFVHALPRAFAGAPAPVGTTVEVVVGGQGAGVGC